MRGRVSVGELRRVTEDRVCWLSGRVLVGRSVSCLLRIRDKRVSGEHARLEFRGGLWEVRDLGSRNGTLLNGQRLEPGHTVSLKVGDTLSFGSLGEGWVLTSAAPPDALAVAVEGEAVLRAESGFLALPEDQAPEVYIYREAEGGWQAERGDESWMVRDQSLISAGGRQWVLHLPEALDATWAPASGQGPLRLADLSMRFAVSADEEHVAIYLALPDGEMRLPTRAHDYMLLTLARARLKDRAQGASPAEEGWLYVDELCSMLRVDDNKLGVDIFRARKVLAEQGIADAAEVIERRRTTRQVRLGLRSLTEGRL